MPPRIIAAGVHELVARVLEQDLAAGAIAAVIGLNLVADLGVYRWVVADGTTQSVKKKAATETARAHAKTGASRRYRLMPVAFMAVISFWRAKLVQGKKRAEQRGDGQGQDEPVRQPIDIVEQRFARDEPQSR